MDFYRVDEKYNNFLQKYETEHRGITKKQEANILIRAKGDAKEVKGSLRFNYMIPVPDSCLTRLNIKNVEDDKYRMLLNKEYRFCVENAEKIQKKANKIYEMVITNRKPLLTENSCDFKLLERGFEEYIKYNP